MAEHETGCHRPFVEHLHAELCRANHRPFYDQDTDDSLPLASDFPKVILEAARLCKIGVVVLSHEYFKSKWTMLELEQLMLKSSAQIFPLFYKVTPQDLSSHTFLAEWKVEWERLASESSGIDISDWPKAVEKLSLTNGEILLPNASEREYILKVVSTICKKLPPPLVQEDTKIKGKQRITQEVARRFDEAKGHCPMNGGYTVLGFYGTAGSGKTTLCDSMSDFYGSEYLGKSYVIHLPSYDNEVTILQECKNALRILTEASDELLRNISTISQAVGSLNERVQSYKVFLAVDNIWEHALHAVLPILNLKFRPGSKVLLTSRSRLLLEDSLQSVVSGENTCFWPVPSITEEEAIEALRFLCGQKLSTASSEQLKSLVGSCCFNDQYHPLLLHAIGCDLRRVARRMVTSKALEQHISRLQVRSPAIGDESQVLSILTSNFDNITDDTLQKIFLDVALCLPSSVESFEEICYWLSMLYENHSHEEMRAKLLTLEYFGLLDVREREVRRREVIVQRQIWIHDLYIEVAKLAVVGSGQYLLGSVAATKTHIKWRELERIVLGEKEMLEEDEEVGMKVLLRMGSCAKVKLVILGGLLGTLQVQKLSVESMKSVRILHVDALLEVEEEIRGWDCLRELRSLRVSAIFCVSQQSASFRTPDLSTLSNLQQLQLSCGNLEECSNLSSLTNLQHLKLSSSGLSLPAAIGDLSSLANLQHLDLSCCASLHATPNLSSLTNLQKINFSFCSSLKVIQDLSSLASLHEMELTGCSSLQAIPDLSSLTSLQTLLLCECSSLQAIPDLSSLTNLHYIDLSGCSSLQTLPNLNSLASLQTLLLCECSSLQAIPDLSSLTNLHFLDLSGCSSLQTLPNDLNSLVNLQHINLSGCSSLLAVPDLRSLTNLQYINISRCSSLQTIPDLHGLAKLRGMDISGCSTHSLTCNAWTSKLQEQHQLNLSERLRLVTHRWTARSPSQNRSHAEASDWAREFCRKAMARGQHALGREFLRNQNIMRLKRMRFELRSPCHRSFTGGVCNKARQQLLHFELGRPKFGV